MSGQSGPAGSPEPGSGLVVGPDGLARPSWAATDPEGLRSAARSLAEGRTDGSPDAQALRTILSRYGPSFAPVDSPAREHLRIRHV